MIRSRLIGSLGFLLFLNVLHAAAAERITIDESKIRIQFAGRATLNLPVTNTTKQPISTTLHLEFLGPNDRLLHHIAKPIVIAAGTTVLQADVSDLMQLKEAHSANYGWLRLRYSVLEDVNGIVSLSKIAPEPFVMDVISPRDPVASSPYRVQVLARDPVLGTPVPNVEVRGEVASEDEPSVVVTRSSRTNASGYAELNFDLPRLPSESDLELEVRGKLGTFVRIVSDTTSIDRDFFAVTSMDKPIYQPGEKLRIRTLVFDRLRNAVKSAPVQVSILDPDDDKVFQTSLVTSAFGEAHTEWTIPGNTRVGNYEIRVGTEDEDRSIDRVWIGRYDLPNFSVDVRQKRPYYLPGQHAEVDIRADYLFGKPVPFGAVKVVREIERSWNYREMKWEVEEGEVIEGTADRDGLFQARLSIDNDMKDLTDRRVYTDVPYAVFVTDPSTGRTEQRRFWTRITLFPIHLYVRSLPGAPLEFYVSAAYADGRPALCDVEIHEVIDNGRVKRQVVRTNQYGVAKVRDFWPSARFGSATDPHLEFRASDGSGNTGQLFETFDLDEDSLRLYTDKALYRPSEPIAVRVESSVPRGQVVVNAAKDGRVLYSTVVHLSDGKGNIAIPSSKAFRGSVLISAYHSSMSNSLFEGRRVSFPEADGLEIEPSFDKKTYAPGEQATLTLQLRNEDRSAQRGVFGVTVFDKAVEERARMDAEFGGRYSICHTCGSWFDDEPALPGLTVQDLHRVDRNQPVSPDLELAAEILLLRWYSYDDQPWSIGDSQSIAYAFHSQAVQKRIDALKYSDNYPSGFYLPRDEPSLREMVLGLDPEFDTLRDSWDNTYRLRASVLYDSNQIEIISSGADEVFNSGDDFRVAVLQWPYFSEYGKVLRTAIAQHHERTGGYVRDIQTLKDEVRRQGQDFDAWRDPQDKPYTVEFGIDRTRFTVDVKSQYWILWRDVTDYTAQLQPRIDTALNQSLMRQGSIPEDDSTLRRVLRDAGISDDDLKDPWGRPYYSNFKVESGYFDSVIVTSGLQDGVKAIPITQRSQVLRLRSAGPDGLEGTSDDFTAISFLRPVSQQTVEEAQPRFIESPLLDPSYGAVYGVVLDSSGAVIPGVSINLTGPTGREISVITAEDGHFQARNVDPGTYQIRVSLPGFQRKILTGVFVRAGVITRVVATLEVASVAQMVEVAVSAGEVLTTSSATVGEVVTRTGSSPVRPISTPRLREYFPETLLWQPALETGTNGRAQVRFKLADSITTWKAVAIASTKDGRIAVSEKEIVAFQPFFVEHDPPKLLTEGDQIALPVVVRSYLDRDQSIDLSMKNEDWFVPLDSASRKPSVKAGEFVREVFPFKAVKPVTNGKQRVTAQGSETSDAIEKTSTVYPFGREVTQVSNGIFRGTSSHNITVPPDALAGTVRAELKIYPNLMAHVADSIEGIMQRPYGCAEQVISSAYPSLLFLNYAKQTGRLSDPLAQKAKRYLAIALESLRGYQSEEGGFSYWTRGEPDTAVTAYAVQFLHGAEDFIEFDGEILSDARWWLRGQQGKDGSWKGNPKLTSYVVSVLSTPGIEFREEKAVSLAIEYLQKLPLQSSEPYVTASIALAALQSGNRQLADAALNVLRSQVHNENTAAYWMLETNTPFYGWGLPGRLETTALAVRALAAGGADAELVDKGLLFLLLNKDRYGMWYSTQATVRVLDVLVRLVGDRKTDGSGAANVLVNGVKVATVAFGSGQQPYNPVVMDLSKFMKQGANNIEVVEQKKTPTATVQLVESHYVPWNTEDKDLTKGPLRLSVQFDTTEAAISDAITVQVEAERIGFRGYGMMLAEIGLPPGAEVDRESMAAAVASSGWDLSRYDVLPDRVLVYVWPRAGGTKFEFKFRPRYGLEARSPASKLYDYYNPEAYSILTPVLFKVR